jgi:Ca-activated chloride channel homolog
VSFARPALLAGLALIPVLLALYVRSERRPANFAPARLMPSIVPSRAGWRRHAAIVGYGGALAVLLVALAKPQTTVAVARPDSRVVVVTDRSGSMRATDVKPTRLAAAKRAAGTFLDALPASARVGAVVFNTKAEVLQSPTRDHAAVREALKPVRAKGHTAIGDALKAALGTLKGKGPAAIVLLSDGDSVAGSDPLQVAQTAKQRKIPVFTVALGTPSGTIHGKPAASDPQTLARIAQITGGRSFTAQDADQLDAIYGRVGTEVSTVHRKQEITNLFAGAALALMAMSALVSLRLRGRLV